MNVEAIQKKIEEYFSKTTPEQILKEFEALGVEFVAVPEVQEIEFIYGIGASFEFNEDLRSWLDDLSVDMPGAVIPAHSAVSSEKVMAPSNQDDIDLQLTNDYQYAMAA